MRRLWVIALSFLSVFPAAVLAQRPVIFRTEWGGPRLRVSARVATGLLPKSVTVSPDGRLLAVCNFGRTGEDNVFLYDSDSGLYTLRWERNEGFSEIDRPEE